MSVLLFYVCFACVFFVSSLYSPFSFRSVTLSRLQRQKPRRIFVCPLSKGGKLCYTEFTFPKYDEDVERSTFMRKRLVISVFAILLALSLVGVPGVCYAVSDQAEPQTTAPGEQAPETEQTTAPTEKVPE